MPRLDESSITETSSNGENHENRNEWKEWEYPEYEEQEWKNSESYGSLSRESEAEFFIFPFSKERVQKRISETPTNERKDEGIQKKTYDKEKCRESSVRENRRIRHIFYFFECEKYERNDKDMNEAESYDMPEGKCDTNLLSEYLPRLIHRIDDSDGYEVGRYTCEVFDSVRHPIFSKDIAIDDIADPKENSGSRKKEIHIRKKKDKILYARCMTYTLEYISCLINERSIHEPEYTQTRENCNQNYENTLISYSQCVEWISEISEHEKGASECENTRKHIISDCP